MAKIISTARTKVFTVDSLPGLTVDYLATVMVETRADKNAGAVSSGHLEAINSLRETAGEEANCILGLRITRTGDYSLTYSGTSCFVREWASGPQSQEDSRAMDLDA